MCFCCERSPMLDRLTSGLPLATPGRREFLARAALAVAVGSGVARRGQAAPVTAEVIFRHGTIRTMAAGRGVIEALAIGSGRILAAGTAAEVNAFAGHSTRIIDLQGRTALPGLIDPHHHSVLAALLTTLLADVGTSQCRTRDDALAALKALAAKKPSGEWIVAGFYDNLLQGGELTGADLDGVSTSHPIFVLYVNGHVGAANRLAFDRAKIPPDVGTLPGGGHFGRGPDGQLDGRIYEQPALLTFTAVAMPAPTPAFLTQALTAYAKRAAAAGNTTLHEPGTVKPEWVEHLAALSNDLAVRLSASFIPDFVHLYGAAYRDQIFGPARAEFMVPTAAAARAGLAFTLHSDAPAAGLPINPLRHVQTAVTRRCLTDGSRIGPDLAVSVEAALEAITASAARQIGLADALGTLEPGKEADLTILESDPCTADPEKIAAIRVSETWVAGERKFG